MITPPFCHQDDDPDLDTCGHTRWAVLYCVSFIVISSFLLVNLVLAAVLKQFEEDSDLSPDADQAYLTSTETKEFCMTWANHNNDYFMPADKLGGGHVHQMECHAMLWYVMFMFMSCDGWNVLECHGPR